MKGLKKYMAGILVAGMVLGSAAVPAPVYATEAEDAQEDNGDDVEITLDDKPYLALGADLTADRSIPCYLIWGSKRRILINMMWFM